MSLKKDALVEFSITPLGVGGSVSGHVARVTKIIRDSGLDNELHSMGTIIEGTLDECFDLIKDCIRATLTDSPRASVAIKMDVRPGHEGRIKAKVSSVESKLKGQT